VVARVVVIRRGAVLLMSSVVVGVEDRRVLSGSSVSRVTSCVSAEM
jgi:hypothetical protein